MPDGPLSKRVKPTKFNLFTVDKDGWHPTFDLRMLQKIGGLSYRIQQLWRNRKLGTEDWRDLPVVKEGSENGNLPNIPNN